ncbi:MAG: hypothetical protein ACFHX7_04555 [Pseudomonadota bacterium]
MSQNDDGSGNRQGKGRSYSPTEEHQLIAFVLDECGGQFGIEEAREIAARLNKKTASIVAKARSLNLDYRTGTQQPGCMDKSNEARSLAVDSFDWQSAEDWAAALSTLHDEWHLRAEDSLWAVRKSDLLASLQADADAIEAESLFSSEEIEARRELLRSELESSFLESMTAKIKVWPSLFRSKTHGFEALEKKFRKKRRQAEYQVALEKYQEQCARIAERPAEELFERAIITRRRFDRTAPARSAAFDREMAILAAYDRYIAKLDQLPHEDIDDRLDKLRAEFLYVRRARVWYAEFEYLIDETLTNVTSVPGGGNESPVRLLQNDFLLVMEQRLNLYWRLHQVREKAFADANTEAIGRLGYLESTLTELYRRRERADLCDEIIANFLNSVEKPKTKPSAPGKDDRAGLLQIDHGARRAAWDDFKMRSIDGAANITRRFNELKDIIRFTPEWIREYKIFQADLLLQRSMDAGRKNTAAELRDVENFVHRLVLRIELELEIDIAYRSLEQKLVQAGDNNDALRTANREMAAQIKARGTDEIIRIKQEFLLANGIDLPGQAKSRVVSLQKWRS